MFPKRFLIERRMAAQKFVAHGQALVVDWCLWNRQLGQVEECYPSHRYDRVICGSGSPSLDVLQQAGVTILAFGVGGQWFGLRRRKGSLVP